MSLSFKASLSLQVIMKPSPAVSKLARGYRDFKIPRVRLDDCLILVRIISRDLVGRMSRIWGGVCFRGGLTQVEEGHRVVDHCLYDIELGIRFCESKRGQLENGSRMIECSNVTKGLTL
jgi:hypothetical protein